MRQFKIAGIGEILWDVLPNSEELGGAPINFSYHVSVLGAKGFAISTVGNDRRGYAALNELKKRGLDPVFISISQRFPTGYVPIQIDNLGIATYLFPEDVAWDHLRLSKPAQECAGSLDAVYFGTLAQRSKKNRATIHDFLKSTSVDTIKVYDLNLRQNLYTAAIIETSLNLCNVLKLNDEELITLSKIFALGGSEQERLAGLLSHYQLDLIILTRGDKGSVLLTSREISNHPGTKAEINDTIGAGDSFTAAAVVGLLLGKDLDQINSTANNLAAHVCSQAGAMPLMPEQYRY